MDLVQRMMVDYHTASPMFHHKTPNIRRHAPASNRYYDHRKDVQHRYAVHP